MNIINFNDLKNKTLKELEELTKDILVDNKSKVKQQELLYILLNQYQHQDIKIIGSGILEIMPDGFGFLRSVSKSYIANPNDIYIGQTLIRKLDMRSGDDVSASLKISKDKLCCISVRQVETINNQSAKHTNDICFENLTPEYACERLEIERDNCITSRIIDLAAPIGKGQRGLIVAPPKTGKTTIMKTIALSIAQKHPECHLITLLVGERPEEVTEIKRLFKNSPCNVEVIASTFDDPITRHVQLSEIVLERAKRLVENNKDVVILLDSLTRLARAYNELAPSSGKLLSGGIDAQALHKPKRFFGAARNTAEAGSLTIIATVLVDTGSKMDDIIFEEFKGTGNMELYLNRKAAERQIFPAINFSKSGTRREDLIIDAPQIQKVNLIKRVLSDMDECEAVEFIIKKLQESKSNAHLFSNMKKI